MADPAVVVAKLVLRYCGNALNVALRRSGVAWSPLLASRLLRLFRSDARRFLRLHRWLSRHRPSCLGPAATDLLVDALGRAHRLDALRRAVDGHSSPSIRTFAIAAERLVSAGRSDLAVRLFLESPTPPTLPLLNALLAALCRSGRIAEAESLFRSLRRRIPPDAITFNTLADGWCRAGSVERAVETLRRMVMDAGIQPTAASYNILLKGFLRTNRIQKAIEFFREMIRRGCKPDAVTYTTLISEFGRAGEVDRAFKIFEEMIDPGGCHPTPATYNAMIQLLCRKVSTDKGLNLFNEMKKKGYNPNKTTYNILLKGLCDAHRVDQAMEFLTRMKKESEFGPNTQTYNILIRGFCMVGEIERGRILLAEMGKDGCIPDSDSYSILVSAFCATRKKNEVLESGKLLQEMIEKGFTPPRLTVNRVMNGLIMTGNQEFAREFLRRHSQCGRLPCAIRL
ncbi:pentatricopeptide repeat-containing protein At1g74900, mitochondrial-like [Nymphaea colorata]|nr:pentatricopeptide repeat-containing protein At1g74900, mitochondrial-like [Nymphaea colorata]